MTVASSSPPSRLPLRRAEEATSKLKIRKGRGAGDDGALAAVFIAPALFGFLVFLLWPTLRGIYLSFTRFNLLTPAEWVGLDNYARMIRDPVFSDLKVLEPLDSLGIEKADYQPGLADNWVGEDGHRYGAPKDWDTVALFYNKKMAKAAGISAGKFNALSWNPEDGGTYEKAIAHLTIDRNGKRGDEPGFDKDHVKVYGLATGGAGDDNGQTQWSPFTGSDLASDACQTTVGEYGVVFPATPVGTRAAVAAYGKKGIDTTAFTQPVADEKDFTTFSFPITNYAADVYALMRPAMQDLYGGGAPASGLDTTNSQINFIFDQ
ncbi:hypothetical protein ACWGMA_21430 [Streptomyces asiaticus]